jgi:uncharacterized phage protein gp47/JayE
MQITDLVYIDSAGYHFADYPSFLAWLQDQYRAIYGADVYLEADSQDGQFLAILAKAFYDTAALGGSVYNSFSPVTAQGVGLSRNVKINGLTRRVPSHSSVDLTIVGQAGTVITGGIATDALNQKWLLPTTTIPDAGTVVATAVAELEGAVEAAMNTVNQIFTPTRGWQTVNNASAATPGAPVESDAELRVRQAVSTANPSQTVLDGTVGGVANLEGVTKVRGYENDTGSTDGNGIPAHSISIAVVGGDAEEIAQEILLHKTPGTGTFGDTSELVYDAHGMPNTINFERPDPATIDVTITIDTMPSWSAEYEDLMKAAVAAAIEEVGIGETIFFTKLFLPAYLVGTPAQGSFDIVSLEISISPAPPAAANIDLDWNQYAVCTVGDITVVT